jgi:hypothetical protein
MGYLDCQFHNSYAQKQLHKVQNEAYNLVYQNLKNELLYSLLYSFVLEINDVVLLIYSLQGL